MRNPSAGSADMYVAREPLTVSSHESMPAPMPKPRPEIGPTGLVKAIIENRNTNLQGTAQMFQKFFVKVMENKKKFEDDLRSTEKKVIKDMREYVRVALDTHSLYVRQKR